MIYSELLARKDSLSFLICLCPFFKKPPQNAQNEITALLCFLSLFSCCLSHFFLPQARQLILQHGLTLSDLDRHPEVWWALHKLNWKPWKWGRATISCRSNSVSLNRSAAEIMQLQKRPEWWSRLLQENVSRVLFALFSARLTSCLSWHFHPHSWMWRLTELTKWTLISRW